MRQCLQGLCFLSPGTGREGRAAVLWLLLGPVEEPLTVPGGPLRSTNPNPGYLFLPKDPLRGSPDTCVWPSSSLPPPSLAAFSSHTDLLGSSQTQAS